MGEKREIPRMIGESSIAVSLPSEIGYERVAMACTSAFAKTVGFQPDRIEDLKTAVSEACLNAMEHGNKGLSGARVSVIMDYECDLLSVSVLDEGEGIQEFPEEPDIVRKVESLEIPRGLGIFLIKKLVDRVEFNRKTNGGHMVRMTLRMGGQR